ncbi:MAG: PAS domain S-box protein [Candidatus Hydrogenedentes bacterium]|nr:PAS domain S-box protein [Candidatus Hydrogenedentota bacterium]
MAAFAITALGSYRAASTSTYVEVVKWSQVASIVGQVSLLWLVARLTRAISPAAVATLTAAYAVATLMHIMSVSGLFLEYLGEIHLHPIPGLEGLLPSRVPFYAWRIPIDLANVTALIAVCYASLRQFRSGDRVQALLTSMLVLVVFSENLHDMFVADSLYLAPIGLLLMLAVFLSCPGESPLPAACNTEALRETKSSERKSGLQQISALLGGPTHFSPWDHSPLIGLLMAMLLVSAAQALAWHGFESIIILLALLGMGHATISVLYRAGSSMALRSLAIVALAIIALPHVTDILYAMPVFPINELTETHGVLHGPLRDWLWLLGLLLLLTAFSLSGNEAGEARKRLIVEHDQLLAEAAVRRKAELELQTNEERFRRLVENSTDLVAILGPEGVIRDIGASVQRILGYAPEVLVGKSIGEYCHPDDIYRVGRALRHISSSKVVVQSVDVRILVPDGTWRVIECISDLQFDPVLNGIIVNARDITERKSMEERLTSARTDERQRIRHDLHDTVGQDLAGLLCMTGSLAMELQGVSGTLAAQANAIVEGVQRTMEDVRNAIMGIAPIEMHPRGLEVALEQLVERLRTYQRIDVRFECPSEVNIDDYGVATQMFLIAQEAITNAVKHAQASRIAMTLASSHDRIVLAIVDDGVGMDGQERPSKGLGLQTMQSRAAAIGAWLRVSGAAGKGTQVKCVLARELHQDDLSEKGLHDFAI